MMILIFGTGTLVIVAMIIMAVMGIVQRGTVAFLHMSLLYKQNRPEKSTTKTHLARR